MVQFPWVNGNAESISTWISSVSFQFSDFLSILFYPTISQLFDFPSPFNSLPEFQDNNFRFVLFSPWIQGKKKLELPYPPIVSEDNFREHYFKFLIYFLLNTLVVYFFLKRHLFSSGAVLVTRLLKPLQCWYNDSIPLIHFYYFKKSPSTLTL